MNFGGATAADVAMPTRTGIELLRDSYSQIAAEFEGTRFSSSDERGGQPLDKMVKATVLGGAPAYRLESTFSPTQYLYVGLSATALNRLAQGRPLVSAEAADMLPVEERITGHFLAQPPHVANFETSVCTSIVDIFSAFTRLHPNLTPALSALSAVAGIDGATLAFDVSRRFLADALDEPSYARQQIKAESAPYLDNSREFVADHCASSSPEATSPFNVHCVAEAFAKRLLRGAGSAALTLLDMPEVRQSYNRHLDPFATRPYMLQEELGRVTREGLRAADQQNRLQPAPGRIARGLAALR